MPANAQTPPALVAAWEKHSNEVHAKTGSYPTFKDQLAFEATWWAEEERRQERRHFPNLAGEMDGSGEESDEEP